MIRAAAPADAGALAAVQVRAWLHAYQDIVPPQVLMAMDVDEQAEGWPAFIEMGVVRVAEVGGRAVGFTVTGPAHDPRCVGDGELYAIYIDPAAQGAGLGTTLLADAEEQLRAAPYAEAILWTFVGNGLSRRFYEGRGWTAEPEAGEAAPGEELPAPSMRYRKVLA